MSVPKRYPSDEADKFMLRLPPGLRERIAEAARAGHRSMNSELVMRIQASLRHAPVLAREPAAYPVAVREEAAAFDLPEDQVSRVLAAYASLPARKREALLVLLGVDPDAG